MRMDTTCGEPVRTWLARASLDEIREVIATLGEERFARRVARAILEARGAQTLERTGQLAAIVARAVRTREPGKHPATRTFQALRMYINDELGELRRGLTAPSMYSRSAADLVVITFHSLEDRSSRVIRDASTPDPELARLPLLPPSAQPRLRRIGRKLRPGERERERNPRSRSALLRVARRPHESPEPRTLAISCRCCGLRPWHPPPGRSIASTARVSCSSSSSV